MPKNILIADDSALIRKELGRLLGDAGFEVDYAKNGQEALEMVLEYDFDAVTMDINMPVLDGVSALKEIMRQKPTPVLMVSSLTQKDADISFECLELGAVDIVGKPGTITLRIEESGDEIVQKVKAASRMPKNRLKIRKSANLTKSKLSNEEPKKIEKKEPDRHAKAEKVIMIGSSTGGPRLIEKIVRTLPANYPYPVCVVQHMPQAFTEKFAARLNSLSALHVLEARNNEAIVPGKVIIGRGGHHIHFGKKASGQYYVKLAPNLTKRYFCPSVDEMFFSASKVFDPSSVVAIELTGIGDDGADGMVELRNGGAYTLGESEESAIVYGMPKEAYRRGGVVKQLGFDAILEEIVKIGRL